MDGWANLREREQPRPTRPSRSTHSLAENGRRKDFDSGRQGTANAIRDPTCVANYPHQCPATLKNSYDYRKIMCQLVGRGPGEEAKQAQQEALDSERGLPA